MKRFFIGLIAVLSLPTPAAAKDPVSLVCAANGVGPYYLTLDYNNGTVTIRDWGTYRAMITDRLITWRSMGNFNTLNRETGSLEMSGPELKFYLQCNRGEPVQRF